MKIDVIIPTLGLRKEGLARMLASVEKHSPGTRCIVANETSPRPYAYIIRDLIKRSDADAVIWAGDSCEWTADCAGIAARAFQARFMGTDACLGLNMTNRPPRPNCHEFAFMAVGRKFIERFPDALCMCPYYQHFWVDTELGLFAKSLDRFLFLPDATLIHPMPDHGEAPKDETHEAGRRAAQQDHDLRRAREKAGLLWGAPIKRTERLNALGKQAAKWSIFHNDPRADRALMRFLDGWFPNRYDLDILEIGTCRGVSAAFLAERGHVTTLDVCDYAETQSVLDAFAMASRVTRIIGPADKARALVAGRRFDMVFIDGLHEYERVSRDWKFCRGLSDRILFHDYCPAHPGVVRLVDELKAETDARWDCRDTCAAMALVD